MRGDIAGSISGRLFRLPIAAVLAPRGPGASRRSRRGRRCLPVLPAVLPAVLVLPTLPAWPAVLATFWCILSTQSAISLLTTTADLAHRSGLFNPQRPGGSTQ